MAPCQSAPIQLLEISMISAQDLATVSKNMRTFGVAWLNPDRKLTTRVDQKGHNSPTWNEKFVFRVDDNFLEDENSALTIEIYESAWLRDVLIGSVTVLIADLVPPSTRSQKKSQLRFVALQVRRPSGRPKGILNIGVTLLDSTKRSLPIYSDLSASSVEYLDLIDVKGQKQQSACKALLQRSKSERTDSDYYASKPAGSVCNGSMLNGSLLNGSMINGSEVEVANRGCGKGGMGSLCSDVGPSPSVVAAAIAKGLYLVPAGGNDHETGSSILGDWTEQDSVEGLKTKIERWRSELPPIYDHYQNKNYKSIHQLQPQQEQRRRPMGQRKKTGGGLFSCFVFGCEFTISCGGDNRRKKKFGDGGDKSELTFDGDSYL
ncbi:hypothetical protein FNV43_RR02803 [Rhamnella rubrinervis]|uniref:C2 domain-containing protein n=1 Tax=Rhamnella rubrinervis TaxID=2594499 RepID=A0A8K0HII9_9ROSA|nr:hypothetical protein FNV43_RR02803 [Rhamnella rubrinervis]